ncbi:unnamed protein product [Malus baccata var. baccata]
MIASYTEGMNADGQICAQRAVDKVGKEFATGLEYRRSFLLASLNYNFSFSDPPTWFLLSKVNSGHLDFTPEDGGIKVGRNQGDLFQAYTLMKVNNEADGDAKFKVIGGLPILGAPYEEFIPPNHDPCKKKAYPSTFPELLRIHSQLCKFYGQKQIFWNQWLDHFYRGKIIYASYGEKN